MFGLLDTSAMLAGRGKNIVAGVFSPPSFELGMARKDVRLMLETADARPLAVLPGVAARMDALIAEGRERDDLAVLGKDVAH